LDGDNNKSKVFEQYEAYKNRFLWNSRDHPVSFFLVEEKEGGGTEVGGVGQLARLRGGVVATRGKRREMR
jgi:hypothetical protein